jgi:hypothetical protein
MEYVFRNREYLRWSGVLIFHIPDVSQVTCQNDALGLACPSADNELKE